MGEGTDVCKGAGEGTKGCRAKEEDGTKERDSEEESLGQGWKTTEEMVS
jgi:hypothetical protein